jgi:hypothetical protein
VDKEPVQCAPYTSRRGRIGIEAMGEKYAENPCMDNLFLALEPYGGRHFGGGDNKPKKLPRSLKFRVPQRLSADLNS